MIATMTATEHNHTPARILGRVERGETIIVAKHGQAAAAMIPQPRVTSGAELARKLRQMEAQPETARAIEAILQQVNESP